MKITIIYGCRPELIRLSRIISKLDKLCTLRLVHTGQNYDPGLHGQFFKDLDIRQPDISMNVNNTSLGKQLASMLPNIEDELIQNRPDKILILGDTNSALSVLIARRLNIPVYHMEAGNRCFDMTTPEEANRHIIDALSTINLPYTSISKENLLREGHARNTVYVTGNPIGEVLKYYEPKIYKSNILKTLKITPDKYLLATFHRAENVDDEKALYNIMQALCNAHAKYKLPIIVSVHPKTKERLLKLNYQTMHDIRFCEPFGFTDFIKLEQNAKCVISDSGTVPEECAIMGIHSIVIRTSMERPELLQTGCTILAGNTADSIDTALTAVFSNTASWNIPIDYMVKDVSNRIIKILMGIL